MTPSGLSITATLITKFMDVKTMLTRGQVIDPTGNFDLLTFLNQLQGATHFVSLCGSDHGDTESRKMSIMGMCMCSFLGANSSTGKKAKDDAREQTISNQHLILQITFND
jgi:hypothetical protein